jgi:hypothetical protein
MSTFFQVFFSGSLGSSRNQEAAPRIAAYRDNVALGRNCATDHQLRQRLRRSKRLAARGR